MMGCITLSFVHLIQLFFPEWSGVYMVVGAVVAALEANTSDRLVRARRLRGVDLLRFRLAELALLFIGLRVGSLIGTPTGPVLAILLSWWEEPWRILDLEVGYAFLLALSSWTLAHQTAYDLRRIGEAPAGHKGAVDPVDALMGRFFWGGGLLLVVAGLTRVGIAALLQLRRPSVPGLVLNVLVYFVLGLAMLGQVHYSRLSWRWREEGTDVSSELAEHWVRYTLIFFGLVGLIAFILPTGYTVPLLTVASVIIGAILYAANLLFYLVTLLFFILLTPLAKLFGADLNGQPPGPVPQPSVPGAAPEGATPEWLAIVRSVVFWAVAVAGLVYLVRSYLRDRRELAGVVSIRRLLRGLRGFLVALWQRLARLVGGVGRRIPARLRLRRRRRERYQTAQGGAFRFFRLRALSRRERTLFYYLSTLRRAAQQGYPRPGSETPYEYEARLAPTIDPVEEELDRLTRAFVRTRYSTHEVRRHEEVRVRAAWRKVRTALGSLRLGDATDEGPA
jgi:hypothetical protein